MVIVHMPGVREKMAVLATKSFSVEEPPLYVVPKFHFWDYLDSKTASVATVQAKARKGWKLFRVSQGFGAAGGTASYEHALVGPQCELFKVSTRTVASAGVSVQPDCLQLSMQVLLLEGAVKAQLTHEAYRRGLERFEDLGARWNAERRCWMVRPEAASDFSKWIPDDAVPVPMFMTV